MIDAECKECGWVGSNWEFSNVHVSECMRGAPDLLPGEGFDAWSKRVKEWRSEQRRRTTATDV